MAQNVGKKSQELNLDIEQGATFDLELTWTDAETPPVPINLTDYTARMQIRATLADATVIHESTTVNGEITLGGAAGTITFDISATTTAAFTFTDGVYDLELISSGGIVTRLVEGCVVLHSEVTR